MNQLPRVLCCDDDAEFHQVLKVALSKHVTLESAFSVPEAKSMVTVTKFDAILVDLHFEGQEQDGLDLIDFMNQKHLGVFLIVVSGDTTTRRIVEATRRTHFEFVPKDADLIPELVGALVRAFNSTRRKDRGVFGTDSSAVKKILSQIERVVESSTKGSCLILGETGTGKEILARHIAKRLGLKIQAENMAAVPRDMAESVLFGHEKGSFTGAASRKVGSIEAAHGGIFFLDEVGECSLAVQAKLLRVLETKEVVPLGAVVGKKVDVRFIAATHADLEARCAAGTFRGDLYQRLNTFIFRLPALRNRPEDIVLYANLFLAERNCTAPGFTFDDSGLSELVAHSWPGNTRELKNVIERLVVLADNKRITGNAVRAAIQHGQSRDIAESLEDAGQTLERLAVDAMNDAQKRASLSVILRQFNGNKRAVAKALKKSESTIYRWVEGLKIEEERASERRLM